MFSVTRGAPDPTIQSDVLTWRFALDLGPETDVCPADPNEDNDTAATATPLAVPAPGQPTVGTGSICLTGDDDPDFWAFQHGGGPIALTLQHGSGRVPLPPFEGHGSSITSTLTGPAGDVPLTSPQGSLGVPIDDHDHPAGRYVLEFRRIHSGFPSSVPYTIRLSAYVPDTACSSDPYEPNSFESPAPITLPADLNASSCTGDGVDSFSFEHTGGLLDVGLVGDDLRLDLIGEGTTESAEVTGSWAETFDLPAGTYIIDITPTSRLRQDFRLTVGRTVLPPP
jgi:hypothetical protein